MNTKENTMNTLEQSSKDPSDYSEEDLKEVKRLRGRKPLNGRYYVTAIDSFMSGWGLSKGKVNVLVFSCDNTQQQDKVFGNCVLRSDMNTVRRYETTIPFFDPVDYFVQYKDKEDYPNFYIKNFFK